MSCRQRDARDAKNDPGFASSGCKTLETLSAAAIHLAIHPNALLIHELTNTMPELEFTTSPACAIDDADSADSPVFSFRPQRRPRGAGGRAAAFVLALVCVALAATVSIRSLRRQTRVPEYLLATHTSRPSRQPTFQPTLGDATCGMKAGSQPVDCDKWDQGSCGNACCVLDVHVDGAVDDAYEALAAYLESGGGDGLYAKAPTSDTVGHVSEDDQGDYPFEFSPALPWRYTTSGFHATTGGYVDQLKFSVGVTSGGNAKVRMSSISGINGALGDYGQNYKNLAFLAAGLGWDPPTVAFGCGHR